MILLGLLLVPIGIAIFGLLRSQGKVTPKEFAVHVGVVAILISLGYLLALNSRTRDTEIWNGKIARKWKDLGSCCHSYPCNCHEVCSGSGSEESCSEECDTCYEHMNDVEWHAETSNGETAYSNTCNPPETPEPERFTKIIIGEPTAIEHGYTNYIKGNPDTILKRTGIANNFKTVLPKYPEVYDYYRTQRFLSIGAPVPDVPLLNKELSSINAELGSPLEVNITVIVTSVSDQMYLEALREHWLGGKKNDLIVVVGTPAYPAISWAGVISWTKNEDLKVILRNKILDLGTFNGEKVLGIVKHEVSNRFIRRPMRDFEYLKSTIEPPAWACWIIFSLGTIASIILQIYFWQNDPFGSGYSRYRFRRY